MYYIVKIFLPHKDNGVKFLLNGEEQTFCGSLTLVSGDNLGSNYIGGFKQICSQKVPILYGGGK